MCIMIIVWQARKLKKCYLLESKSFQLHLKAATATTVEYFKSHYECSLSQNNSTGTCTPPPPLIRPLFISTQATQLVILIYFCKYFVLIIIVNSCNVCMFSKLLVSNKPDLLQATCCIIQALNVY